MSGEEMAMVAVVLVVGLAAGLEIRALAAPARKRVLRSMVVVVVGVGKEWTVSGDALVEVETCWRDGEER